MIISESFTAFVAIIMYTIIARTSVDKTVIILLNHTDYFLDNCQQNPFRWPWSPSWLKGWKQLLREEFAFAIFNAVAMIIAIVIAVAKIIAIFIAVSTNIAVVTCLNLDQTL